MEVKGKKVLVFGLGISGIGAGQILERHGAEVIMYDGNQKLTEEKIKKQLGEDSSAKIVIGDFPEEVLEKLDMTVLSPGVPTDLPVIEKMREQGITVIGEVELAYQFGKGDVLAITGTNGKTTTKDMLAQLLSTTYLTYKTQGNYNNEIGLPYTVLHMPEGTDKLVLEMGQDHLGDIHLLSELAHPKAAIVTLIGEAHLEFFKDRSEIAKGKLQIADGMPEGGLLVVPADPIVNAYLPEKQKVVRFGPDEEIFITELVERKDSLTFRANFLEEAIDLPVTGKYNATNAMIAAYVALQEGVSEAAIRDNFATLQLTRNRTEWKKASNGADILSDVYNANPTAMRLILETFSTIPANPNGRKLAVLADMKELGEQSVDLHNQIILSLSPDFLRPRHCRIGSVSESDVSTRTCLLFQKDR